MHRVLALLLLAVAAVTANAQPAESGDRIIVSGASGNLGELTVRALLERGVPGSRLILVSRTPEALAEIESGRAAVLRNDVEMSYVTRADCAAAAAAVLTMPGHENKVYDITGPAVIGTREIAEAAAAVSGKPIEIVDGGAAGGFGLPSLGFVSTDFETLTGHQPTSVRELLESTL